MVYGYEEGKRGMKRGMNKKGKKEGKRRMNKKHEFLILIQYFFFFRS